MKKTYVVDYDLKASLTVEIDHEKMTDKELHEINNFWIGHKARLQDEDGNVLNAVLKYLAATVFQIQLVNDYNLYGVVCEFDWDDGGGVEGWPKMDGTHGIKITEIGQFRFDSNEMRIKEKPKAA